MTRIVGRQNRSEFILDPVEAWHRGGRLDRMLAQTHAARPRGEWLSASPLPASPGFAPGAAQGALA